MKSAKGDTLKIPYHKTKTWSVLVTQHTVEVVKRELGALMLKNAIEGKRVLDYFLPTCIKVTNGKKSGEIVTQTMDRTFVFFNTNRQGMMTIMKSLPQLNLQEPESEFSTKTSPLTFSEEEIQMLRNISDLFGGNLPCYEFTGFDLDACDKIQVISGQFGGVIGVMYYIKGRVTGRVMVPVKDLFMLSLGEINPHNYRVLEFGKGNRHYYNMFDRYLPIVSQALYTRLMSDTVDPESLNEVEMFSTRYEQLQVATLNIESTYAGLMLMSSAVLKHTDETEMWLNRCKKILKSLTSNTQLAQHLIMMYSVTGDVDIAEQLQATIEKWKVPSADDTKSVKAPRYLKRKIVNDLFEKFRKLHASLKWIAN